MQGISKIGAAVFARMLDFAFSGYGLVCDVVFLKILVQHVGYQYDRYRRRWMQGWVRGQAAAAWHLFAGGFRDLLNPAERRMGYYRERR